MILFMIFKAVIVGVLFGGLIFAIVSSKSNLDKTGAPLEQLDGKNEAALKKSPSKTASSIKIFTKFIFTCFIALALLVVPFVILRIIL